MGEGKGEGIEIQNSFQGFDLVVDKQFFFETKSRREEGLRV